MNEHLARALAKIDEIHADDPTRTSDGRARETIYAERMTHWLERVDPAASEALRVAVRAQHLARWRLPRDAYPEGRVGYLAWRKDAREKHAADVRAIVLDVGYDDVFAARVASLVMKKDRSRDAEAQSLEDCACLVFLELDYGDFVSKYDDAKVIDVVKKTWAKMSARARDEASTLALEGRPARLVRDAIS